MESHLVETLQCPACHGALSWKFTRRRGFRIEEADARCEMCGKVYPVREGIGVFLTSDLSRHDLWEPLHAELTQHLTQHPETERRLMNGPLETLNAADQLYRALVLEDRGDFAKARAAREAAYSRLYTPEYMACWESQVNYVVQNLSGSDGTIVDLASGECRLVEVKRARFQ